MIGRGRDHRTVERALDLLERRALFADTVDWPAARATVREAEGDPEQLELAFFKLVREAGGPHSGVRRAARRPTGEPALPTVEQQGEAVVVTLPACPADAGRAYVQAGRAALDGLAAERWIVDLRGNGGGSMWPMLAVVAPLLRGDGELGFFVTRDGARTPWTLRRGAVGMGRSAEASGEPGRREGPVSVLTDGHTASSGEAVAVAFRGLPDVRSYGAPTLGFSTGNESVPLPGGLLLTVTTSRFADRTGEVYGGKLEPDVPSEDPLAMALWDL